MRQLSSKYLLIMGINKHCSPEKLLPLRISFSTMPVFATFVSSLDFYGLCEVPTRFVNPTRLLKRSIISITFHEPVEVILHSADSQHRLAHLRATPLYQRQCNRPQQPCLVDIPLPSWRRLITSGGARLVQNHPEDEFYYQNSTRFY